MKSHLFSKDPHITHCEDKSEEGICSFQDSSTHWFTSEAALVKWADCWWWGFSLKAGRN